MIRLTDDYYIVLDEMNWTLKKTVHGKSKKGKPITTERILGYYGRVWQAVEAAADYLYREDLGPDAINLEGAVQRYEALTAVLKKAVKIGLEEKACDAHIAEETTRE